jgi:hypothetical protein
MTPGEPTFIGQLIYHLILALIIIVGGYFIIPRKWRKQSIRYRLPVGMAIVSLLVIAILLSYSMYSYDAEGMLFFMWQFTPFFLLIMQTPGLNHVLVGGGGLGAISVGTVIWMLIGYGAGVIIDATRKNIAAFAQSHSNEPMNTQGQSDQEDS